MRASKTPRMSFKTGIRGDASNGRGSQLRRKALGRIHSEQVETAQEEKNGKQERAWRWGK